MSREERLGRPRCHRFPHHCAWTAVAFFFFNLNGFASAVERNTSSSASPLLRIVVLLEEMRNRSQDLLHASDQEFASASAACDNTTATETAKVDELTLQVENHQASIGTLTVEIQQLETDATQYNQDTVLLRRQLEDAREQQNNETVAFQQDLTSFDSGIAAVERAMEIVSSAAASSSGLAATGAAGSALLAISERDRYAALQAAASSLRQARERAQRARTFKTAYQPEEGGMIRDEHIFDDFQGLSTVSSAYQFSSTSVESVLEQLKASFQSDRDSLLQRRQSSLTSFQAAEQSMLVQTQTAQTNVESTQQLLVEKRNLLMNAESDLAETSAVLKASEAYLGQVQTACSKRQQDHQEMRSVRLKELSAITKAIDLLSTRISFPQSGVPAAAAAALLKLSHGSQVVAWPRSGASSSRGAACLQQKLLPMLRQQASRLRSSSLADLVARLAGSSTLGISFIAEGAGEGEDPLAKVKLMIHDLLVKLQQQAAQEADHKAYCDTELGRNDAALEDAQADIESHSAKEAQLNGSIGTLDVEIAELNQTLEQGLIDRPAMLAQRWNESAANRAIIEDANMSAAAVEAAIEVLQEYYENASNTELAGSLVQQSSAKRSPAAQRTRAAKALLLTGRTAQAQPIPGEITETAVEGPQMRETFAVINVLQVLLDDYLRIVRETELAESEAEQQGIEILRSHDVMFASTQREYENKLEMKAQYELELSDTRMDLNHSQSALTAAEAIREQLRPPCLDVDTYEEKKARREQEIAALNEAYDMVVAFEQESGGAVMLLQEDDGEDRMRLGRGTDAFVEVVSRVSDLTEAGWESHESSLGSEAEATVDAGRAGNASNSTSSAGVNLSDLQSVIDLLAGIRRDVAEDLDQDTVVYENLTKWCAATISEKQAVLATEAEHDSQLVTLISTSTQNKARLTVEIEQLEKELQTAQQSLAQQIDIRSREAEAFHESEKELLESIQALSHALIVLSGHYSEPEPMLNASQERARLEEEKAAAYNGTNLSMELLTVAGDVKRALKSLPAGEVSLPSYSADQSAVLQSFLMDPGELLLSAGEKRATLTQFGAKLDSAFDGGHQIFGILEQLKETFEADLQTARSRESTSVGNFEALRDSKMVAVQTLEESISIKELQLAEHTASHASAQEDLTYVRESSQADFQHLLSVQSQCTEGQHEFELRNRTRHEELASLDEAIDILTAGQGAAPFAAASASNTSALLLHGGRKSRIFVRHRARRTSQSGRVSATKPASVSTFLSDSMSDFTGDLEPASLGPDPKLGPLPERWSHGSHRRGSQVSGRQGRAGSEPSLRGRLRVLLTIQAQGLPRVLPQPFRPHTGGGSHAVDAVDAVLDAGRLVTVRQHDARQAAAPTDLGSLALAQARLRRGGAEPSGEALNAELSTAIHQVAGQIDTIRGALEQEKELEIRMKDTCISERSQAEQQLERRRSDEAAFNMSLQRLDTEFKTVSTEIYEVSQQITELNSSMNTAGEERNEEYQDFRNSVMQQEAHTSMLHQALRALKRFYGTTSIGLEQRKQVPSSWPRASGKAVFSFLRREERAAQGDAGKRPWWNGNASLALSNASRAAKNGASSASLGTNASNVSNASTLERDGSYARDPGSAPKFARPLSSGHGSNTGAIAIIEMLIEEAERMLEAILRAEEASRAGYADSVEAVRRSMAEKERQTVSLYDAKGNVLLDLQETIAGRDACQAEMQEINTFLGIVESRCTYLVANFVASQQARQEEIQSLHQAKNALLGMVQE